MGFTALPILLLSVCHTGVGASVSDDRMAPTQAAPVCLRKNSTLRFLVGANCQHVVPQFFDALTGHTEKNTPHQLVVRQSQAKNWRRQTGAGTATPHGLSFDTTFGGWRRPKIQKKIQLLGVNA